jgi:cytochrome c peroxidase
MKKTELGMVLVSGLLFLASDRLLAQGGMRGGGRMDGGMSQAMQVPADNPITPAKVELGKQLYFDGRLSRDGTVSCNSCHNLAAAGADTKSVSTGVGGAQGTRNPPTVWNSAFHNAQFLGWSGPQFGGAGQGSVNQSG